MISWLSNYSEFFNQPNFKFTDCECSIQLVCQLVLSINKWNFVTRIIWPWITVFLSIEWFFEYWELIFTASIETRATIFRTLNISSCSHRWKVAGASQVEQKGGAIGLVLAPIRWLPVLNGEATYTIAFLNLK